MFAGYGWYGQSDDGFVAKCYHKYEEKLLVGVHTYWQCCKCDHNINFNEITKSDDIIKRISMHKLPWEK